MEKLLLIDGNSLLYKAYYASAFLIKKGIGVDAYGKPVNALRTFSMMMLKLREDFNDYNILVVFDHKDVKTYRSEYSFYKSGRTKTPEELIYQKPLVEKFLSLFGINFISDKNYEADDIIGILANKFSKENNVEIKIITSDKDLLQLVDNNVSVLISKVGVSEMIENNMDNFASLNDGLKPKQIIDLKGIMGDNSDNLAGIKGIGPKNAIALLTEYDNLENVISNIDNLSETLKNKIIENKEIGLLCKKIATIIIDGNLDIKLDDTKVSEIKKDELIKFLNLNSIYNVANRLKEKW